MSTPFFYWSFKMDKFELVQKVFPNGVMSRWNEVNGLPATAIQDLIDNENVQVLAMTLNQSTFLHNQYHMIVEVDGYFLYGRVCDASTDSDYAMYAALFDIIPSADTKWYNEKVNTMVNVFSNADVGYNYRKS